jgi:lipocalin
MKFRHQILRLLPIFVLACSLLAVPAQAQLFQQGPKLLGTGGISQEQGWSVSLSRDGNTAIVGGPGVDTSSPGAAWVFTRSNGVWSQQAKLVGTGAINSPIPASQGASVSLSDDGNTAIVGGYVDNGGVGAVWVFTRSGGAWTQQGAKLVGTGAVGRGAWQGFSVALSGDGNTVIVGGPSDGFTGAGAAWVFTRSGGVWTQQGDKLVGTGAIIGGAWQGWSVSLSDDGNTAIVGGPVDNGSTGAVWVFTRSGGVWTQQGDKLVGTGAVGFAFQGDSVALSEDGNTAIVGGFGDNSVTGAAWVFTRSGTVWAQQGDKLVGTGAIGPFPTRQGWSVSLSDDGNTAIVGGLADNDDTGAAWLYTRSNGVWSQQAKLVGTGAIAAQ